MDISLYYFLFSCAFVKGLDGLHYMAIVVLKYVVKISVDYFIGFESEEMSELLVELD